MPKTKTVTQLKKKHRNAIWRDEENDLWYWDTIKYKWCVLLADIEEDGFYSTDEYDPVYYNSFTRIAKAEPKPILFQGEDRAWQ